METYIKSGLAGIFSGMRSMAGLAFVSYAFSNNGYRRIKKSPLKFLTSPGTSGIIKAAALSELVIDKIPESKSR